MTPIGSALDLRSIWVDGQASHDPVGRAWENVAGEEGREVLKEIDFSEKHFPNANFNEKIFLTSEKIFPYE